MTKLSDKRIAKIVIQVDADLEDLIPGFLERRRQDLQEFHTALANADFKQIRQRAHTLKGVGGGYGFDALSSISRQLEQAAKQQAVSEIETQLIELADYLERVEVVFV